MGEAIAITSGKGGVGKSSVCINVGIVLAQKGFRVCMIDMDLGLKNLDVMLGLENRVIYDLHDVMEGHCTLQRAMIRDKREGNLYLLPACKTIHIEKFNGNELQNVVQQLKENFDYILLDTPAGIERGFVHSIQCVNRSILVTTLDVSALQDCDRIIGILMKEGLEDISFLINRMNPRLIEKGVSVTMEDAKQWLSVPFLGYVFDDEGIMKANNYGIPASLQRDTLTYSCFDAIVRRILGEKVSMPRYREKNILKKIFG